MSPPPPLNWEGTRSKVGRGLAVERSLTPRSLPRGPLLSCDVSSARRHPRGQASNRLGEVEAEA